MQVSQQLGASQRSDEPAYPELFQPISIGNCTIDNRIVMAPMNVLMNRGNTGYVIDQQLAYYAARAKGGTGLIMTECVLGTKLSSQFPYWSNLHLFNGTHIGGLAELVETVHAFGVEDLRPALDRVRTTGSQSRPSLAASAVGDSLPDRPGPDAEAAGDLDHQAPELGAASGDPAGDSVRHAPRDDQGGDPLGDRGIRQLVPARGVGGIRRDRAALAARLPGAPVPLAAVQQADR